MKLKCDLHIHTCLSPCGDMDMTPNNIANMAVLKGLDIIAVSDHNTVGNTAAVIACADRLGLLAVPAMELETSENIHFVCLFDSTQTANSFYNELTPYIMPIKNNTEIFGIQAYMNDNDEITGYEEQMLVTSLACSIYDVIPISKNYNMVIIPAHIDKSSYSIMASLGTVPTDLGLSTVEISRNATVDSITTKYPEIKNFNIITSSDAHYLWDIYENENILNLKEKSISALFDYLRGKK